MRLACLDLEGVLIPEVWIAVAEATGIDGLRRTTRDEPDYDVLMKGRLEILDANGLTMALVEDVIASAGRHFVLHGQDPRHDMEPWGKKVYFGTAGAAVCMVEARTGSYRDSTVKDLHDIGHRHRRPGEDGRGAGARMRPRPCPR